MGSNFIFCLFDQNRIFGGNMKEIWDQSAWAIRWFHMEWPLNQRTNYLKKDHENIQINAETCTRIGLRTLWLEADISQTVPSINRFWILFAHLLKRVTRLFAVEVTDGNACNTPTGKGLSSLPESDSSPTVFSTFLTFSAKPLTKVFKLSSVVSSFCKNRWWIGVRVQNICGVD